MLKSTQQACSPQIASFDLANLQLLDKNLTATSYTRPLKNNDKLASAVHLLSSRATFDPDVLTFTLAPDNLFSSQASQTLLIYENDFLADEKRRANAKLEQIACYLESLRQRVEANGYSHFIVAPAPDKYSVYQEFIRGASTEQNLFERLQATGVNVVRTDRVFQQHVTPAMPDLYLPNDTHWGSDGNRLYASIIAHILDSLTAAPTKPGD